MNLARYQGTHAWHADSVAVVSYWHIPNGCEYDRAQANRAFFNDPEAARRFAERYSYPPECAFASPWPTPVESMSQRAIMDELKDMYSHYRYFDRAGSAQAYEKEKADREFCKARINALKTELALKQIEDLRQQPPQQPGTAQEPT